MDKYLSLINELNERISIKKEELNNLKMHYAENKNKIAEHALELEHLEDREKLLNFHLKAVRDFGKVTKPEKIKHFIRGIIKLGAFNIALYGTTGLTVLFGNNTTNWALLLIFSAAISTVITAIEVAEYLADTNEMRNVKKTETEKELVDELVEVRNNERGKVIELEKLEIENKDLSREINRKQNDLDSLNVVESNIYKKRFEVLNSLALKNEQSINESFDKDKEINENLVLRRYKK